jgi:hypothetical protein
MGIGRPQSDNVKLIARGTDGEDRRRQQVLLRVTARVKDALIWLGFAFRPEVKRGQNENAEEIRDRFHLNRCSNVLPVLLFRICCKRWQSRFV